MSNLIAGATYSYYVVANYVDGTKATSNTQEVTLTSMTMGNGDITAIDGIMNDSEIDTVTYVNMAGAQSSEPFEGINIKVVRYKNGTMKSTKILY